MGFGNSGLWKPMACFILKKNNNWKVAMENPHFEEYGSIITISRCFAIAW